MQDVNRLKLVLVEQKKGGSAMLITSWRANQTLKPSQRLLCFSMLV